MHTHVRCTTIERAGGLPINLAGDCAALSHADIQRLLARAWHSIAMLVLTVAIIVAAVMVPAKSASVIQRMAGSSPQLEFVASVYSGDVISMRATLEHGASVDAADPTGTTPLMIAAHFEDDAPTLFLLSRGAKPNRADCTGTTPLMYAARADRPLIARQLLLAGADPDATDNAGNDALAIARMYNGWQVADILERGALARARRNP